MGVAEVLPVVELDRVTLARGGRPVLQEVDLTILPGQAWALLGSNGAGKTTILAGIAGELRPTQGAIRVFQAPAGDPHLRARVGIVHQETVLQPELTVRQQLTFFARLYGRGPERVAAVIATLALEAVADRLPGALSGGFQRRVALARALVHEPRLVLIDEPGQALDGVAREDLWSHLRAVRRMGVSLLVATHDVGEAIALCSHAAILAGGRVVLRTGMDRLALRLGACVVVDGAPDVLRAVAARTRAMPEVRLVLPRPGGLIVLVAIAEDARMVRQAVEAAGDVDHVRVRPPQVEELLAVVP